MPKAAYFTEATFDFLSELAENNNREWFTANKKRYEDDVKGPALRLISDFTAPLGKLSPQFEASPKSLFRIYRDTRFSSDKRPYKTATGILFRHGDAEKMHSPGYYLHLQPGQVFVGFGVWHPDSDTARAIRDHIVARPEEWKRVSRDKLLTDTFTFESDSLVRPPKGYDPTHPLIDDLKRKDFVGMKHLPESFVTEPDLPARLTDLWTVATPYMRFVCDAEGLPFSGD